MPLDANTWLFTYGPHPFEDARLKLKRARFHLKELETATARFARDSCRVGFSHPKTDDGWHITTVSIKSEPPAMFGVIAGEAAQQMRSALDHIAFQLVNAGRSREIGSYFPICVECKDYYGPRKGRRKPMRSEGLPNVDDLFLAAIDRFQPFEARRNDPCNDPLALLAKFANRDKHRVVPPVWATRSLVRADAVALDPSFQGRIENVARPPGRVQDGDELHRYRIIGEVTPVKRKSGLFTEIAFGDRPYRVGDLERMNERVLDVIEALEDIA